jgi:hypothetical protein
VFAIDQHMKINEILGAFLVRLNDLFDAAFVQTQLIKVISLLKAQVLVA